MATFSSSLRPLALALALVSLPTSASASPADNRGAATVTPDASVADTNAFLTPEEAAEEAREEAGEAVGEPVGAPAADDASSGDAPGTPCGDPPGEGDGAAVARAAADDACADSSSAADSPSRGRRAAPLSLSIPLLLRQGYATLGAVRSPSAGVVVSELTVMAQGRKRRVARSRRTLEHRGVVTPRLLLTTAGRKHLRKARVTLKATLRTTIVSRSGHGTTTRRVVLLVPARR